MKTQIEIGKVSQCKSYLSSWVKHGGDETVANDLIKRKAWDEVFELMYYGDAVLNRNEE